MTFLLQTTGAAKSEVEETEERAAAKVDRERCSHQKRLNFRHDQKTNRRTSTDSNRLPERLII